MTDTARTGLLVSVRSAEEAAAALAGGADLIDVKEPARGALGRADDATIAAVVRTVAGRVPVSAAMGELHDHAEPLRLSGVAFAKWGLAGWGNRTTELGPVVDTLCQRSQVRPVLVAYADWARADAPPPEGLWVLARQRRMAAFVIDTFIKDGSTLLDSMDSAQLVSLGRLCRASGVRTALAGSLGAEHFAQLRHVRPDWFAVRGAACSGGRAGTIDEVRVRVLKEMLSEAPSFPRSAWERIAPKLRVAEPPAL